MKTPTKHKARHNERYAIVASCFNQPITDKLLAGARAALTRHKVDSSDIHCLWVPGAFEIPLACKKLMASGRYATIITLGSVIRGETSHFDYVAGECARGIMQLNLQGDIPIIFGILTTDNMEQALARADPKSANKGADFALAAVDMVRLSQHLAY